MRSSKSIMTGVAVLAALALPMVAGAANKLVVNGTDGTTPKMVVTDTGAVGIGTSTPGAAVEINGLPGNVNSRVLMRTIGTSTAGGGGILSLHNNASTTNNGMPLANDRLGFYLFGTKNATANATGGGIMGMAEGNWTADTSYPTYFTFITAAPGSITQVERMRITAAGNIGIGTNVPKQQLEVNGGIRINNAVVSGIKAVVTPKPTCDNTTGPTTDGGVLWFTKGASGVKDSLEVCAKDASNNYSWRLLY